VNFRLGSKFKKDFRLQALTWTKLPPFTGSEIKLLFQEYVYKLLNTRKLSRFIEALN
jgi:hypothetical protein